MPSNLLRAAMRGAAAAAVGTAAMDLLWYARYRRGGGTDGFPAWELSSATSDFAHAGTPAQVGRRLVEELAHVELPDRTAAVTNDIVHWATGIQWGMLYGVATALGVRPGPRSGALLGIIACSTSYVLLPKLDLYKPIWTYDAKTLAQDYSAHLLFGWATGCSLWAMARRS